MEQIVEICKEKKIPISRLEKDLGYGNGYLNPKKVSDIKVTRLLEILSYLKMTPSEFFRRIEKNSDFTAGVEEDELIDAIHLLTAEESSALLLVVKQLLSRR